MKKKKKPSSVSSTFQKFQCDQTEAETSLEITPFLGFLPFPVQMGSLPDSFLQEALPEEISKDPAQTSFSQDLSASREPKLGQPLSKAERGS